MKEKNRFLTNNRLSGRDKKLTVMFVGAGHGQITIHDNVARCMNRKFVGRRTLPTRVFCYKNGYFVGGGTR